VKNRITTLQMLTKKIIGAQQGRISEKQDNNTSDARKKN